jgi:hypothetical protein
MKKIITILFLSSLFYSVSAQDLIVTNEGDSINCKIKQIKDKCLYFTFKHKDEVRNTLLQVSQVKSFKYGYYKIHEVPEDYVLRNEIYPHFRFAITGGYSYRVAKMAANMPATYKDYVDNLRSGYHVDADLTYFFNELYGCGLKYSYNHSENSEQNISYPTGGSGYLEDNVSIHFIGPSFSFRTLDQTTRNSFYMNMAIGYLGYLDDGKIASNALTLKGSTLGIAYDLGYDIGISKNMTLGFQFSYLTGTLTQYEMTSGYSTQTVKLDKNSYESLSRLDFSVGLRIYW